MTSTISVAGLTRRYGDRPAVDDVTFDIEGGSLTGLLGRNGAGKTTVLRILAGQELASDGIVRVLGANPIDNDAVLRRMVLVREDQAFPDLRTHQIIRVASWFYPNWSAELAEKLRADFELPANSRVSTLSRGMRSALGIVIGLAARCEVTLLDEPYAGLDAVARRIFYDHLLADFAEHPRTVLISTHLIDEIADLLERVIVIDRGRVVLDAGTDGLRGTVTAVSGPVAAVEQFVAGRQTSERRRMASHASVVVLGALDDADCACAHSLHLHLEPLSLQQIVSNAAGRSTNGPDQGMRT